VISQCGTEPQKNCQLFRAGTCPRFLLSIYSQVSSGLLQNDCKGVVFRVKTRALMRPKLTRASCVFSLDSFKESWHGVKITHSRLERFVEYAVTAGLGTRSEILLCMVPAFSFWDFLPNENVLSLMPSDPQRIQQHGWARTAGFYYSLLESDIGVSIEEYFCRGRCG